MSAVRRVVAAAAVVLAAALGGPSSSEAVSPTLDPSFGVNGRVVIDAGALSETWRDVAVAADGSLIGVGEINPGSYNAFATRRGPDGSADPAFGVRLLRGQYAIRADAEAVALQPDGKIVVAGRSGPPFDAAVWRLLPSGSPDPTFGGGDGMALLDSAGDEQALDVAIAPDGRIVVVGETTVQGGQAAVYRLTSSGDPDYSFDQDGAVGLGGLGADTATSVVVQADGRILVTGAFASDPTMTVRRLTVSGDLDSSFGGGDGVAEVPGTAPAGEALALLPDGRILVAGSAGNGRDYDGAVARLTPAGVLDPGLGGDSGLRLDLGGNEELSSIAVLPDGGAILGGFSALGSDAIVLALDPAGSPDASWGEAGVLAFTGRVLINLAQVAVQPDGKVLVLGQTGGSRTDGVLVRLFGTYRAPEQGSPTPTCAGRPATIIGTEGKDRLIGTARADVVLALGGSDVVKGLGGDDVVCAGDGNDHVSGGPGKDRLYGEGGKDRLSGGAGKDRLVGGAGKDATHQRVVAPTQGASR